MHHLAAVLREVPADLREDSRAAVIPVDFRVEATLPEVDREVVTEAACRVTWEDFSEAAVIWKTA